jgi:hypothetical protein
MNTGEVAQMPALRVCRFAGRCFACPKAWKNKPTNGDKERVDAMRIRVALSIIPAVCLMIGMSLSVCAQETTLGTEYVAFWYEKDAETDRVTRVQMSSTEYETKKNSALEGEDGLLQMYTEFLNKDFTNATRYGYTPAQAQQMVNLDQVTLGRMQQNQDFYNDTLRQMAEWTFFYNQLELWNKYVEESVLRVPLKEEEKPDYNPATAETNLATVIQNLEKQAKTVSESLYKKYRNPSPVEPGLVDRIEKSNQEREFYLKWLEERENDMLQFVETWRRQYDGTEIRINDVQYLVRNVKDRPSDIDDDHFRASMPDNAVLVEVPKAKLVTPFDLINPDGTLKTPDDQRARN